MKSVNSILLILCIAICIGACGGSKEMVTKSGNPPEWFNNPPTDPDYLYEPGTAESKSLTIAVQKAKSMGRLGIGGQIEGHLTGLIKQFMEEIGEGEDSQTGADFSTASKFVVSQTLNGCKAVKQITNKEGVLWTAYVLMEYPIGEANSQFLESIKKKEILRQKAASTEAFKELDDEVEKYENRKASMN